VYEDAQQIELAGTITEGMCNNSITIPKQMIVKRKAITLENPKRKKQRSATAKVDRPETTGEVSTVDGQGLTQLSNG
jgi:hypothetical protein